MRSRRRWISIWSGDPDDWALIDAADRGSLTLHLEVPLVDEETGELVCYDRAVQSIVGIIPQLDVGRQLGVLSATRRWMTKGQPVEVVIRLTVGLGVYPPVAVYRAEPVPVRSDVVEEAHVVRDERGDIVKTVKGKKRVVRDCSREYEEAPSLTRMPGRSTSSP